jgi:hypothetical protein
MLNCYNGKTCTIPLWRRIPDAAWRPAPRQWKRYGHRARTPRIGYKWPHFVCACTSLMLPTLYLSCRWAACRGASWEFGLRAAPPRVGLGVPVPGTSYCCLQVTLQPSVALALQLKFRRWVHSLMILQESFFFLAPTRGFCDWVI